MKQIIILFSTILLGIAIGGLILSLQDSAQAMIDSTKQQIMNISGSGITNP